MIGRYNLQVGDEQVTLRLSTRSMMALEEHYDAALASVFQRLDGDEARVADVVTILSELMDDGKGQPIDAAAALMDRVGFAEIGQALAHTAEKAFAGMASGNGQGVPPKK